MLPSSHIDTRLKLAPSYRQEFKVSVTIKTIKRTKIYHQKPFKQPQEQTIVGYPET